MIGFESASITDVGKRRAVNQDRLLLESITSGGNTYAMFAVADGMGGLADGERAAEICIQYLADWWKAQVLNAPEKPDLDTAKYMLYDVYINANETMLKNAGTNGRMMGSTLTAAFFCNDNYIIMHVGDCRAYGVKRRKALLLTEDHTWVRRQVTAGILSNEQARNHPKGHILTNCIGNQRNFFVDIAAGSLTSSELMLICSDGLHKYVKQRSIPKYFRGKSVQDGLDAIMKYIYKLPADDNISGVAAKLITPGEPKATRFSLKRLIMKD